MSLLTGFNLSLNEVALLGQASQAAFIGGTIPAGWTVVTPAQLDTATPLWRIGGRSTLAPPPLRYRAALKMGPGFQRNGPELCGAARGQRITRCRGFCAALPPVSFGGGGHSGAGVFGAGAVEHVGDPSGRRTRHICG
jgi:hypothetical protein